MEEFSKKYDARIVEVFRKFALKGKLAMRVWK